MLMELMESPNTSLVLIKNTMLWLNSVVRIDIYPVLWTGREGQHRHLFMATAKEATALSGSKGPFWNRRAL